MARILIVDDEDIFRRTLAAFMRSYDHEADHARTLAEGVEKAREGSFDVVFLDVIFPEGNGLDVLARIKAASSSPEVIMMTGRTDPEGAALAIQSGAWDYIDKATSLSDMSLVLARALEYREKKLAARLRIPFLRDKIVGDSPALNLCLNLAAEAAQHDANVLLTGESGTGKELFARAIHDSSPRARANFVVVDCAALPDTLVESMLFGHEKGSFTGADKRHDGLVKQADGGTLFLDEVGELPLALQKAFLRVLQERRFRPVGGESEVSSDFRLVASTNRNLDAMVERGQFRIDLLYRLRTFFIELPSLRERMSDIPAITMYQVTRLSDRYGLNVMDCSPDFLSALAHYDWPGNVRELFNALERAVASASYEGVLHPNYLPADIRTSLALRAVAHNSPTEDGPPSFSEQALLPLRKVREAAVADVEERYLRELLARTKGDIKEACRVADLSRPRLYALLQKYTISRRDL